MKIFFQDCDFVCFEILDILIQRKMQKERKGNETASDIQMSFQPEWTISSQKQTTALLLCFLPYKRLRISQDIPDWPTASRTW